MLCGHEWMSGWEGMGVGVARRVNVECDKQCEQEACTGQTWRENHNIAITQSGNEHKTIHPIHDTAHVGHH